MTQLPQRLLLNVAYQHLHRQLSHGPNCDSHRCADGCKFVAFNRWLNGPVLASEVRTQRLIDERLRQLPINVRG